MKLIICSYKINCFNKKFVKALFFRVGKIKALARARDFLEYSKTGSGSSFSRFYKYGLERAFYIKARAWLKLRAFF